MNFKYISSTPSLGGRIKQIANDFVVSEIGSDYATSVKYIPDKKVEEIDWTSIFNNKPEGKDYLILDMEKNNLATTTAISQTSRFLQLSRKRISYAGLKDKRALTSQRISLFEPNQERLAKFYFKNIKVYNPFWSDQRVDIGNLKENNFVITIRQIKDKTKEEIKEIIENTFKEVQEKGLINYFGEQRFGGAREVTHKVGKLLIKKRYKEAVMMYLTETSDLETDEVKEARKQLKEDLNFRKHAANFPTRTGYESAILNYLANNPEDYLGSFKILPKSIQYLFTHAYQSYMFNELINLRIEKGLGLDVIEGDHIINNEVYLPLFGFESKLSDGRAGELEKQVLDKEKINFKHFHNSEYSVVSSKGEWRKLKTSIHNLKLLSIEEDDMNEDMMKAIVSFTLDKGQYATVFLREIIKKEIIG